MTAAEILGGLAARWRESDAGGLITLTVDRSGPAKLVDLKSSAVTNDDVLLAAAVLCRGVLADLLGRGSEDLDEVAWLVTVIGVLERLCEADAQVRH